MTTGRSKPVPAYEQSREFAFRDEDFLALSSLATELTGIHLPHAKRDMVYGRLARRLRALRLPDFAAYRSFIGLEDNRGELAELINALTTPVSHFWREPHHFEHLERVVLPWVTGEQREARIWSAGCAAGQEAYMLAMALERCAVPGRILATDVNTGVLKTAEAGRYDSREMQRLPLSWRERYWRPKADGYWQAQPALQARVAFRPLNLQEPWPPLGRFDAIFCRNVMIYFDAAKKRRLLNRFAEILQPGGWLYIGHAETIMPLDSRFRLVGRTSYRLQD